MSFPTCSDASSGGSAALQAALADDSSWSVQDGNGFTRSLGRYRGICFTILVNDNECNPNGGAGDACCTTKKPQFVQFKLPAATVTQISSTKKCKLSYGSPVATVNGLKRISKWSTPTGDATTKFFNVPLVWKKNAKATTMCVYSDYTADDSCQFEDICGLMDGDSLAAPSSAGNYDTGCEIRIVGRAKPGSSACCTPTFAVESFDSNTENRLAAGAPAGQTIELVGA
jgi:hypothetical protein